MATGYPASLDSYTSVQDKVDVYKASMINDLQDAMVAVQTELGLNPAGAVTDVVTRLDQILADDGSLRQGSSFPGSGELAGDLFFKTDEDVVYFRNNANNDWLAMGQSLSNVIFHYQASLEEGNSTSNGEVRATGLNDANSTTTEYRYMKVDVASPSYVEIITSKWTKTSGVSTVTFYAQIWKEGTGGNEVDLLIDIGGQTGTASDASDPTTPTWNNSTVDVSSLSNGTTYDVSVQLRTRDTTISTYLGTLVMFGS